MATKPKVRRVRRALPTDAEHAAARLGWEPKVGDQVWALVPTNPASDPLGRSEVWRQGVVEETRREASRVGSWHGATVALTDDDGRPGLGALVGLSRIRPRFV